MSHYIKIEGKKISTEYILALSISLMNEAMIKLMKQTEEKISQLIKNQTTK